MITAALVGTTNQRSHGAQRRQVTRGVIRRRCTQQPRCLEGALVDGDPSGRLSELFPSRSTRPGAHVTIGVNRHVDDAGPQGGKRLWAEPAFGERALSVALTEHIG